MGGGGGGRGMFSPGDCVGITLIGKGHFQRKRPLR